MQQTLLTMKRFFLLSLLAFALAACQQVETDTTDTTTTSTAQTVDMEAAREAIAQIDIDYARGMNEGYAALLTSLHTDDAAVFPPGMAALRGKDAIAAAFAEMYAEGVTATLNTMDIVIAGSGDLGYITGSFTDPTGSGKYLTVVSHDGASWRILADMWNYDLAR